MSEIPTPPPIFDANGEPMERMFSPTVEGLIQSLLQSKIAIAEGWTRDDAICCLAAPRLPDAVDSRRRALLDAGHLPPTLATS